MVVAIASVNGRENTQKQSIKVGTKSQAYCYLAMLGAQTSIHLQLQSYSGSVEAEKKWSDDIGQVLCS